jgi:hypothetical protein
MTAAFNMPLVSVEVGHPVRIQATWPRVAGTTYNEYYGPDRAAEGALRCEMMIAASCPGLRRRRSIDVCHLARNRRVRNRLLTGCLPRHGLAGRYANLSLVSFSHLNAPVEHGHHDRVVVRDSVVVRNRAADVDQCPVARINRTTRDGDVRPRRS